MTCRAVESKLGAYLDGEISGAEMQIIRAHICQCKGCAETLERQRSIKLALAGLTEIPPNPELENRLVQQVLTRGGSNVRQVRASVAFAVVTLAAALLVASFTYRNDKDKEAAARNVLDQQSFEMARHQEDLRRSDPLTGASGVIPVTYASNPNVGN